MIRSPLFSMDLCSCRSKRPIQRSHLPVQVLQVTHTYHDTKGQLFLTQFLLQNQCCLLTGWMGSQRNHLVSCAVSSTQTTTTTTTMLTAIRLPTQRQQHPTRTFPWRSEIGVRPLEFQQDHHQWNSLEVESQGRLSLSTHCIVLLFCLHCWVGSKSDQ